MIAEEHRVVSRETLDGTARLAALALAAVLLLTACTPESGTVTGRSLTSRKHIICVTGPDGVEGCGVVTVIVYIACTLGEKWPDCKW